MFTQRFSSTPRGARLARRLALHQLDRWGFGHGGALSDAVAQIVAALASRWEVLDRLPVGKTVRAELDL
ncbi:hypothetical protein [Streptomyces sp. NPDC101115]|uniref:hypothetical protein n=1 Tax=Streptomyces sp. NPDC101115 TaxID=3366106 RepID=UPI0037F3D606